MFWDEESRKRIPMKIKRTVYTRAQGQCEKCGRTLQMKYGEFHHTRDPKVVPRAKTVEFLCPTCHRMYGHEWRTRKVETLFETEKEVKIRRKRVVARKKPAKKPKYSQSSTKEELLSKLTVKKLKQLAKENKVSLVTEGFFGDVRATTKEEIVDVLADIRKISKTKIIVKLES